MSQVHPRARAVANPAVGSSVELGLSAELTELLHAIEAHIVSEIDAIAAYRHLTTASSDPLVVRLMQLLLEEEERHHEVFRQMASYVRSDVTRGSGYEAALHPAEKEILSSIQGFITAEHESAQQLRTLASSQRGLYGGLFGLLLDLMAMDSDKHAYILGFVLKQLGGQAPEGEAGATDVERQQE